MSLSETADRPSLQTRHFWTDMVCPDCQRCVRACPAGIDIPALLKAEERIQAGEEEEIVKQDWLHRQKEHHARMPIDCIECGICSRRCPQEFPLLELVRRYAMQQACTGAEER